MGDVRWDDLDDAEAARSTYVAWGEAVERAAGLAATEAHLVGLPTAVNFDVQAGGEGVDYRGADAVEAAGGAVGPAPEFATGVQLGEDHLHAG